MSNSVGSNQIKLVQFTNDLWQHVCPVVRVLGPAEIAGWTVIRGNDWIDGELIVYPERVIEGDIVVIQRDFPQHAAAYENVMESARKQNKFVVYELDDLLTELPKEHPDFDHYLETRTAIVRAAVDADAVIGSTSTLCEYLSSFNPNVHLLPNYLNDKLWKLQKSTSVRPVLRSETHPLIVGYLGSHSHSYDLETMADTLARLYEKYPNDLAFKFWGIAPPAQLQNKPNVEFLNPGLVDYKQFAAYFSEQECDIFIAPLADNLFNRAKSHLKFLECSALGVAGVYSHITPYASIIEHGKNGFLASTPEEWENYLSLLIEDLDMRTRMGLDALATVRKHWLLSDNLNQWMEIYQGFAKAKRIAKRPLSGQTRESVTTDRLTKKMHDLDRQAIQHLKSRIDNLNQELSQQISAFRMVLAEKDRVLVEQEKMIVSQEQAIEKKERALDEQEQTIANQEQTIIRQEQAIGEKDLALLEKEREIVETEQTSQHISGLYWDVMNSRSWRLIRKFQRIRLKLIPRGGRMESFIRLSVPALHRASRMLREEGIGSFSRAMRRKLQQPPPHPQVVAVPVPAPASQPTTLPITATAGTPRRLPAISLIILKGIGSPQTERDLEPQRVQKWLQNQTYPAAGEIVTWDQEAGLAWRWDAPEETWNASSLNTFCQGLSTPYVCLVSNDLLEQDAAYLEINLFALEAEALAFTVNMRGRTEWAFTNLRQCRLPGELNMPLLRTVFAKECLAADWTINLSPWLVKRQGGPANAGKILRLTTRNEDWDGVLPFEGRISGGQIALFGSNILARSGPEKDWGTAVQELHPLETVLPSTPVVSHLPTVIIVQPFLAVGGAEQVALKLMQQLLDRVRFVVVTFDEPDPKLGTTADEYRLLTPYVYTLPDYLNPSLYGSFMDYLIDRVQPAALYIHNGAAWIYNALGELKHRYPDLRIIDQVYDSQVGWINRYDISVVMYTDAHVGLNSKICQAYIQKGVKPEAIHQVENGVDANEIDPAHYTSQQISSLKQRFGLPEGKKVVTFASRLHPQKRPMDFVELARRFSSDSSVQFLMVGEGPLMQAVDGQIHKIGLTNLYRHPFYRPITDILAISDVLVLPSEFEGMPMIIIETQAMGKPVVATDVGNNREVLAKTGGGVVVNQIGNVTGLMDGVRKMLSQPPDPTQLRQITLEHFELASVAQKYYNIFTGSAAGKNG